MTDWVLDIETTLDHNTIRIGGLKAKGLNTELFKDPAGLTNVLDKRIKEGDTLWTWNGSGFDFDVIKRLWGIDLEKELIDRGACHKDGYILAKMLHPDMPGGHSLDNYAKKYITGYRPWKPEDISWYDTAPISELSIYLTKDLLATATVVNRLMCEADALGGKWDHALKVEQRVRDLTNDQARRMVKFDTPLALDVHEKLEFHMKQIEQDLASWLPVLSISKPKPPPKKQFKKDGSFSAALEKYVTNCNCYFHFESSTKTYTVRSVDTGDSYNLPLTGPLPQVERITLGQQSMLKQWLMDQGWKPTWWNTKKEHGRTVKTSPRLNHSVSKEPCPDLKRFGNQGLKISEWLMLRSRKSLLSNSTGTTGLIKRADNNNGFIASDADTCGTNTARWRHKGIVNIPRVSTPYGEEFRSLFRARDGFKMVGWDAGSLEAVIEAHYTFPYDPDYARALTEGDSDKGTDVHTRNMKALNLKDRDTAKVFKYATTYGAQPGSLAGQIGVSKADAQTYFDEFWKENVGLRKLKEDIYREWCHFNKQYIVGLDGRLIATRSEHSLINAKFQSGGAIVMKHAMLLANKMIKTYAQKQGIQAHGLIRYHDEEQWESDGDNIDLHAIGQLGVESITKAGQFLKLNVPVSGAYKIGNNWAETH